MGVTADESVVFERKKSEYTLEEIRAIRKMQYSPEELKEMVDKVIDNSTTKEALIVVVKNLLQEIKAVDNLKVSSALKEKETDFSLNYPEFDPVVKEVGGQILRLNEKRNGQGVIFGIDGLPGSRKSTLLRMIGRYLTSQGYYNLMVEGDIFVNLPLLRAARKKVLGLPLPEELSGLKIQVSSIKENIEYYEVKSLFIKIKLEIYSRQCLTF